MKSILLSYLAVASVWCSTVSTQEHASRGACMLSTHFHVKRKQAVKKNGSMPSVAWRAFEQIAADKRTLLEEGSADGATPRDPGHRGSVFEAVQVSLPLEPPVLKHDRNSGSGQGNKNIVGVNSLTNGGRKCLVYGIGIADDSAFEQSMQALGCETHAFDCTTREDSPAVVGKAFKFHNWCIGSKENAHIPKQNIYVNSENSDQKTMTFKTLSETMSELGHSYLDILKFDMEGFEWKLFETEILSSNNPPEQISFELHTQKANPSYVPQDNVADKDYVKVNQLFASLHDMGYRVTSKELNSGDPACAEFVMVNVNQAPKDSM